MDAAWIDTRRGANSDEVAAARTAAAEVARTYAAQGAHHATTANAVTSAVMACVDPAAVKPCSLDGVANAAHEAARAAVRAKQSPDAVADAVTRAVATVGASDTTKLDVLTWGDLRRCGVTFAEIAAIGDPASMTRNDFMWRLMSLRGQG